MPELEDGRGALACASGMAALHMALLAALLDRRKSVLAADALYGATTNMLMNILEPMGDRSHVSSISATWMRSEQRSPKAKPGCVLMETISNPLLRVGEMDRIAEIARAAGAALMVDNTFATPLLVRPLELGAHLLVHSATKYLAGHGDVLGGVVIADPEHAERVRSLAPHLGSGAGSVRSLSDHARHQDFPAADGAAVRQRLPHRILASSTSTSRACALPGDPAHPDAAVDPPVAARGTVRRDGQL